MLRILKSSLPFKNVCYLVVILIFHSFHSHYLCICIETATIYHPSFKKNNLCNNRYQTPSILAFWRLATPTRKKQINKHWSVQCQQLREIPHHWMVGRGRYGRELLCWPQRRPEPLRRRRGQRCESEGAVRLPRPGAGRAELQSRWVWRQAAYYNLCNIEEKKKKKAVCGVGLSSNWQNTIIQDWIHSKLHD